MAHQPDKTGAALPSRPGPGPAQGVPGLWGGGRDAKDAGRVEGLHQETFSGSGPLGEVIPNLSLNSLCLKADSCIANSESKNSKYKLNGRMRALQ